MSNDVKDGLAGRTGSVDFQHSGVWCCTEKSKCQWQGFALNQGLAWGTTDGPTTMWIERHKENCRGRLVQLVPPNAPASATAEDAR